MNRPFNEPYLRELLRYGRKWDGPWETHTELDTREPDEDDAQLMAAAPQMLNALEGAMRIANLWAPVSDGSEFPEHEREYQALHDMRRAFKQAIEAATGKPT